MTLLDSKWFWEHPWGAPVFSLFFCLENCYNMIQRNGFLCDTQKALSFILDEEKKA
jgi:hypothetical protein